MEFSFAKKMVFRALSENSRASISEIAGMAKCSRITASRLVSQVEKEFGLVYTLDLNLQALGLWQLHVIALNFAKMPSEDVLRSKFANDTTAQLVAMTKGDFDLLVIAVSKSGSAYMRWETALAYSLAEYKPQLRPSQIAFMHIGFIPIDNALLETLEPGKGLDSLDKQILLELNKNSRIQYRELAKKLQANENTVRYRFSRLARAGIINAFTAIATKPPISYSIAMFVNYTFAPGTEQRARKAREIYMGVGEPLQVQNNFNLLAPSSGSYRFFTIETFEDEKEALEKGVGMQKRVFKEDRPVVTYAHIEKLIKGMLPIRNIDIAKHYNVVRWED